MCDQRKVAAAEGAELICRTGMLLVCSTCLPQCSCSIPQLMNLHVLDGFVQLQAVALLIH